MESNTNSFSSQGLLRGLSQTEDSLSPTSSKNEKPFKSISLTAHMTIKREKYIHAQKTKHQNYLDEA